MASRRRGWPTLTAVAALLTAMVGCGESATLLSGDLAGSGPPMLSEPSAAEPEAAPAAGEKAADPVIRISAVGDCAIGDLHFGAGAKGSFAGQLQEQDDPLGYPFSAVRSVFAADDLSIANLEGTFTDSQAYHNPVFSIRGEPKNAQILKRGGIDVVSMANNHSHDYGFQGYADTQQALTSAGVGYFGGEQIDERVIRGTRVVNLGYLGGPTGTLARMTDAVRTQRARGGIVIVSFHWGIESYYAIHPEQRRLGRAAIDAGADLVLGHHPHVLQGIETYRERHIVYSLGNFVFGANSQPKDMDSMILQEDLHMREGRVARVTQKLLPVRISSNRTQNDFRPVLLEGAERQRVLDKVEAMNEKLRLTAPRPAARRSPPPVPAQTG